MKGERTCTSFYLKRKYQIWLWYLLMIHNFKIIIIGHIILPILGRLATLYQFYMMYYISTTYNFDIVCVILVRNLESTYLQKAEIELRTSDSPKTLHCGSLVNWIAFFMHYISVSVF